MSRNRNKKAKQVKLKGTAITSVFIDEASSLTPGLWADPEPKHTKPTEEPVEPPKYATGGSVNKNPMGIFGDSRDGLHPTGGLAGIMSSFENLQKAFGNTGPAFARLQEELVETSGGIAIKPRTVTINNLCSEIELPSKSLTVEEHREFIRKMMLESTKAGNKKMYYGKPSSIPEVSVQTEGLKLHPKTQALLDSLKRGKANDQSK